VNTECRKAIKLLTQYRRLASKKGRRIEEERFRRLDEKRQDGTITSFDLPATLQREFPNRFQGWTLEVILDLCDR
jgi:hypothetical protein